VEHLVRAKLRGVKVHLMARPSQSLRADKFVEGLGDLRIMQDVGIKIRKLKQLKLHAKVLLADKERAIVGSINLSPGSFDTRRELAIRVEEEEVVDRLLKVVQKDWKNGRWFDLSEAAVNKEMKKLAGKAH
jgi:phosphatidylserine/phosphatidylglycerophosphate/cardiolipin synthase-like enzyme